MIDPPNVAPSLVIKHRSGNWNDADRDQYFFTALAVSTEWHISIGMSSIGMRPTTKSATSSIESTMPSIFSLLMLDVVEKVLNEVESLSSYDLFCLTPFHSFHSRPHSLIWMFRCARTVSHSSFFVLLYWSLYLLLSAVSLVRVSCVWSNIQLNNDIETWTTTM